MTTNGSRTEKIQDVLRSLRAVSPDVVGSAMVGADGSTIASLLPTQVDERRVSGMAATLLRIGERVAGELMGGAMEQTYVRGKLGHVILNPIGSEALLIVLTTPEARLGVLFLDIKRRVQELSKLL